jgi:hypothetical protein
MARFRKKPVVIEAFRVAAGIHDAEAMPEWGLEAVKTGVLSAHLHQRESFAIKTLEGTMIANPGDWIIRGVKGELYPCKPDIFAVTYESVD